jgi:glycosyltransferase involved in cell wall biosynthesis
VHTVSLATTETRGVPLVATVHDLLWRVVPEAYPAHGRRWHEAALARALRRAAHFVVPAAEVEAALVDAGAPPAAVSVVPLGSDHLPPPDHAAAAALLARLGVTGPYLLSVGTLEPRKNLRRLTEAYAGIRHRLPEPWPLVVVGPAGWGDRLAPTPGVVLTGEVPAPVLTSLYRRALLVAYVPLVEGFGLPPVEAMAAGTPTVTSPLPGVGGASHLVDPRDVEAIADGLLVVATDERVRRDLVGRGTERAAHLTWLSLARRHLEVWTALT